MYNVQLSILLPLWLTHRRTYIFPFIISVFGDESHDISVANWIELPHNQVRDWSSSESSGMCYQIGRWGCSFIFSTTPAATQPHQRNFCSCLLCSECWNTEQNHQACCQYCDVFFFWLSALKSFHLSSCRQANAEIKLDLLPTQNTFNESGLCSSFSLCSDQSVMQSWRYLPQNCLRADLIPVVWICVCVCMCLRAHLLSAQWHPVRGCFLREGLVCWWDSLSVQVGELPMSPFHFPSAFTTIQFLSFSVFKVANQALLSVPSMFYVFTEIPASFYPTPLLSDEAPSFIKADFKNFNTC